MIVLLDKQKRNTNKRIELQKEGYSLRHAILPTDIKNVYRAKAAGEGKLNGKYAMVCYYQYLVDLNISTVKLTSDIIAKI